jgi:membrane fusion protein (multidrug efflux system)
MKKILQATFTLIFLLLAVGLGYIYVLHQESYPSTDDAYVQSNIVNIAPQITGHILSVAVKENETVKAGALLFVIDPTPFSIAVDHAQSQLDDTITQMHALESAVQSAKAQARAKQAALILANKDYRRMQELYAEKTVSSTQMDQSTSTNNQAIAEYQASEALWQQAQKQLGERGNRNAQIQMAKANLAQAQLDLSHTLVTAPADGVVSNLTLRPGDEVIAAQNVFSIIETHQFWLEANFKETQLSRIHPGQTATIRLDMYPDEKITGKVESIGYGSGDTFALLPAENATGNWVKVTQRFPVRISIDSTNPDILNSLRVGASCTVTIDTTDHQDHA